MSKLGDALGMGMGGMEESAPPALAEDVDALDAKAEPSGDAEVMAMEMFSKATSPEAKVEAMKSFLSACGVMDY